MMPSCPKCRSSYYVKEVEESKLASVTKKVIVSAATAFNPIGGLATGIISKQIDKNKPHNYHCSKCDTYFSIKE